jgi:4-amino-4-deoxy-L-arabinose transferase-like glycosyltransferase
MMLPSLTVPRFGRHEVQRDLALLVFVVAACAAPFLRQPFHLDDAFYLDMARNALVKPLYPNDTPYVFEGRALPDMGSHSHPPLQTYFLALVGRGKAAPGSEWRYHAAATLYSLAAVLAFYFIAARFVERPIWAALGLAAAPLFQVTGHTLMTDVPMLAFWLAGSAAFLWAEEARGRGLHLLAAVLLSAALLTSYQAASVLLLLGFYHWRRKGGASGWLALAAPLAALAAWFGLGYVHYHRFLLLDTLGYVESRRPAGLDNLAAKLAAVLQYQGWLVIFPPFLLQVAGRGLRGRLLGLSAFVGLYAAAAMIPAYAALDKAIFVIGIAAGGLVALHVAQLGISAARGRSEALGFAPLEAGFLALWYFGVSAYCVLFLTEGSARYILPLVPPLLLYFFRRLEELEVAEYRLPTPPLLRSGMAASGAVILSLFWGLALAHADLEFARVYRKAAGDVARIQPGPGYFAGEWGFRHYMREAGLAQLPVDEAEVKGGSVVATPALALPYELPRGLGSMLMPFATLTYEPSTPLRLQDRNRAAFYSTGWGGRLPFSFSNKPLETIEVRQVNLLVEQLPWAEVEWSARDRPWPGYLDLRGRRPLALLVRGDSRILYRWAPEAELMLEVSCGVSPRAYAAGAASEFAFELRQLDSSGAVLASETAVLRPGQHPDDGGWRNLVLRLRPRRDGAAALELRYSAGGQDALGAFASSYLRKLS